MPVDPVSGVTYDEKLTLACSCETSVIVPFAAMLPGRLVVRVDSHGPGCQDQWHLPGHRLIVRAIGDGSTRVFGEVGTERRVPR